MPAKRYIYTDKNIILSKRCGVSTERLRRRKYQRNGNVWVYGGSGTGKTRDYIKPNILQFNADIVTTDPKGTLIEECGHALVAAGYDVRSFNVFQFFKSMHYNPLRYVRTDADILKFVRFLVKNTKGGDGKGGASDPFWEDSECLLYTALIAYLRDWCDPSDYSLDGLLHLLSYAKAKDEDEDWKSPLDYIFEEIRLGRRPCTAEGGMAARYSEERRDYYVAPAQMMERSVLYNRTSGLVPYAEYCRLRVESERGRLGGEGFAQMLEDCGHADEAGYLEHLMSLEQTELDDISLPVNADYALRNYEAFRTAAGKTLKSIIISCNVRLAPLATRELRRLLEYDEMHLEDLGDPGKKTAIFVISEDTDDAYSFMVAMLMWQALNFCCGNALTRWGGRFPRPVNLLIDEFANIGVLVGIHKAIAVIRSRNIMLTLAIQSYYQLKKTYDEETAHIIHSCCDSKLFIGGGDEHTLKQWAEVLGKQSINTIEYSTTHGTQGSMSKQHRRIGRELMMYDEVERLDNDMCLVKIRGAHPWKDKKYSLGSHPNYKWLYDGPGAKTYFSQPFDIREYRRSLEPVVPPESEKQALEAVCDDALSDGDGMVVVVCEDGREARLPAGRAAGYGDVAHRELLEEVESGAYAGAGTQEGECDGL
jgi:type IV secretion system protein VirD4